VTRIRDEQQVGTRCAPDPLVQPPALGLRVDHAFVPILARCRQPDARCSRGAVIDQCKEHDRKEPAGSIVTAVANVARGKRKATSAASEE